MDATDKIWQLLTETLKMNDKVVLLTETVKSQQSKLESVTERLVRVETILDLVMRARENHQANLSDS